MNVVDGLEFRRTAIDPTLDRLRDEIIPKLQTAVGAVLAAGLEGLRTEGAALITGALTGADGLLQKANGDAGSLLDSLDGWTLQISVRLNKPAGALPPAVSAPLISEGVK